MWYIQWNWNKNFLYKSKGAEEARAASCVRHLQGKEAGLSHSRAACAGRVRCWHSCWYDSEGMTGARGTEGHPSVRNMTWPFLWDTSSSPVKWKHHRIPSVKAFLEDSGQSSAFKSLMWDETSKPVLFLRAKLEAQAHEEWEKVMERGAVLVSGSGLTGERPQGLLSLAFWESPGVCVTWERSRIS